MSLKKKLLLLLVAIFIVAIFIINIQPSAGYVLFVYKQYRFESSIWIFLALTLLIWASYWAVRRVLRYSLNSMRRLNPWSNYNHERKGRLAAERGLSELLGGRPAQALHHLKQALHAQQQSLYYYLAAARAAQDMHAVQEVDQLLERALQHYPKDDIAISLTRADLQLDRNESEAATKTLEALNERHPNQPQILLHLKQMYQERSDW